MNSVQVLFCLAAAAGIAAAASYGSYQTQSQVSGSGMARNTVPDTVSACYRNQTAYNRYTRQPMHIENLIAIIRKIEEKTFNQWDMRRIARSILNRFQFDGLRYFPMNQQEYQFEASSEETAKTLLVKSMLPGDEALPEGLLDNDERCALHWMLSHSLNATMRDEEMSSIRYGGFRAKRWVSETESVEDTSAENKEEIDTHPEANEAKDEASVTNNQTISDAEHPEDTKPQSEEVDKKSDETQQKSAEINQSDDTNQNSEETKPVETPQSVDANQQSEETKPVETPQSVDANQQSEEMKPVETPQSEETKPVETPQSVDANQQSEETKPVETPQSVGTNKQPEASKEQSKENIEVNKEESANDSTKENSAPETPNAELEQVQSKTNEVDDTDSADTNQKILTESLEDDPALPKTEEVEQSEDTESVQNTPEETVATENKENPAPQATNEESNSKTVEVEEEDSEDTAAKAPSVGSNSGKDASAPDQKSSEDSNDKKTSADDVAPPANPLQSRLLGLPNDNDVETIDGSTGQDGAPFARQVASTKTKMPIEHGVVYTKWGAVSAARVLAGIAAGLEPSQMTTSGFITQSQGNSWGSGGRSPTPNNPSQPEFGNGNTNTGNSNFYNGARPQQTWNGRKKRQIYPTPTFVPLENVFAGTLSGDIGQAAILNAKSSLTSGLRPPYGSFNNSICPREYILDALIDSRYDVYNPAHSWSYMTEAEIRGGVDGLILGSKIRDWNAGNNMKLSDLLESYYSEQGVSGDPSFRSCDRGSLFNAVDPTKVREQSRTFAWIYANRTSKDYSADANGFEKLVNDAYAAATNAIGNFRSDRVCTRRQTSGGNVDTDDNLKFIVPRTAIYAVIDQTANRDEIWQQQLFLGQLVADLDISPKGSRLGLIDGSSGQILISPNFTDNSAVLSCAIAGRDLPIRTSDDKVRVLNAFKTEMTRLTNYERDTEYNIGEGNGITLLYFIQGKTLETSQQAEIRRVTNELANEFGDVHVMYTSNKVQRNELQDYVLDTEYDFVPLQGGNITASVDNFLSEYLKRSHGRLFYPRCNANLYEQQDEHSQGVDLFLTADTIRYYKISPDYFYSAKNLRLRFTSDNGKARICVARHEKMPNSKNAGQNGVDCKETSGSYVPPGSATMDVEFGFSKPCGKNGKRSGCTPIYVSVTPTTQPASTGGGLVCSPDGTCESTSKVKLTFTHWDMRCNSGLRTMISSPVTLITVLTSLFMWFKST